VLASRISIQTLGTRGDVQPYVALAMGLQSAGHEVQLSAPTQFETFVGRHGVQFAPLPGEFLQLMETPEAKAAMTGSGGFAAGFRLMKYFKPIGRRLLEAQWSAAQAFGPDLMIYHPKAVGAPHIAERLGCPTVLASPLPGFTPTQAFASPLVPFRSLGPLNALSHTVMANSGDFLFRSIIAEWRTAALGLPRRPAQPLRPALTLYAYSPTVLPKPADWGPAATVTGYWFLEDHADWKPSDALAQFLATDVRTVYVGFGSMPGLDPEPLTRMIVEALARTGLRGVLSTGGGALAETVAAPHVYFIDQAPHDRLFPMVSACLHHGGAGTTAAALRAGRPSIICPFFGDQPFWGRIVRDLGAGPEPLDRKRLTVDALANAFGSAGQDRVVQTAQALGNAIRQENGVSTAAASIEQMFGAARAHPSPAQLGGTRPD
jgi:sterol 3beta-glucosyltransferase